MTSEIPSHAAARGPAGRIAVGLGALAQIAAMGLVGSVMFMIVAVFLSLGIGLLPVLGIGVVFLIAFLYLLFAGAWVEYERVDGLYGFGLPPLRHRSSGRPGFSGWLRTLWAQFTDGPMWRGIATAAITTILGLVALPTVGTLVTSTSLVFSPLSGGQTVPLFGIEVDPGWAVGAGAIGIIVTIALLVGITALHGLLVRLILVPSREAALQEEARNAGLQREGAVRASEVERGRIERDLHDGVQPRLVSVGMTLGLARQKIDTDPEQAKALLEEAHTSTKAAITELRQLARGIHASVLDDRGLDAALSALAARSPIPVQLDVRIDGRCSKTAEAAVYFAIAESLTNAAKHSRGTHTRATVRRREDGSLWARIEDDGIGGAMVIPGGGLDGISNRVLAAGGSVRLDSPAGGPTALEVSVPCAS